MLNEGDELTVVACAVARQSERILAGEDADLTSALAECGYSYLHAEAGPAASTTFWIGRPDGSEFAYTTTLDAVDGSPHRDQVRAPAA